MTAVDMFRELKFRAVLSRFKALPTGNGYGFYVLVR